MKKTLLLILMSIQVCYAQISYLGISQSNIPTEMHKFGDRCMLVEISDDTLVYKVGQDSLYSFNCQNNIVQSFYIAVTDTTASKMIQIYKKIYTKTKMDDLVYKRIGDEYFYIEWYTFDWGKVFRFYKGYPIEQLYND